MTTDRELFQGDAQDWAHKKSLRTSAPQELHYWPYCPKCRQPVDFEPHEPFAYCGCGTSEWGHPRPAPWVRSPVVRNYPAPLAAEINALPSHIRSYLHDLETRADPAGDVVRYRAAEDNARALAMALARLRSAVRAMSAASSSYHIACGSKPWQNLYDEVLRLAVVDV
jgi:hypothetical protein